MFGIVKWLKLDIIKKKVYFNWTILDKNFLYFYITSEAHKSVCDSWNMIFYKQGSLDIYTQLPGLSKVSVI